MKKLLLMALSFSALASPNNTAPHLPIDLNFEESLKLYKDFKRSKRDNKLFKSDQRFNTLGNTFSAYQDDMDKIVASGTKIARWLKNINTNTSTNNPVRLSSRGTQRGIPVTKPSKYSPKIVSERFEKLKEHMPKEMYDVIYGSKAIPSELPQNISKEDFIKLSRFASGLYQTATRWNMMQPYMRALIVRSARDIRGYIFFKGIENPKLYLNNIEQLDDERKNMLLKGLVDICTNATRNKSNCKSAVHSPQNRPYLAQAYDIYMPKAKEVYESFFKITNPRNDVEWIPNGQNTMRVVFKNIQDPEIANWLKENVEDEFKLNKENFSLELNFIKGDNSTAYLKFKPGVTPHVKGGNELVMDANSDINEYSVQWTIRHEFGHILRLPDCYTEFYDTEEQVMVNYQLDTTDLMCSRAGLMNERIYEELKKHYLK